MRRFKFKKLVRDKIPEILTQQGGRIVSYILEPNLRLKHLKAKLKEEVKEILSAKNSEDLTEELADILEVLQTLAQNQNIPWEDIEKKRQQKRLKRGGFEAYHYIEFLDVDSSDPFHPLIQYCLARPQDYPEIPIHSHSDSTAAGGGNYQSVGQSHPEEYPQHEGQMWPIGSLAQRFQEQPDGLLTLQAFLDGDDLSP